MADTLLEKPDDLAEADFNYSNSDHEMPPNAESVLRERKQWMEHAAWDHYGFIWFADGKFHEHVMRYRRHVATMSANTLRELIDDVNNEYGHG